MHLDVQLAPILIGPIPLSTTIYPNHFRTLYKLGADIIVKDFFLINQ
jgi:hypothetical protein